MLAVFAILPVIPAPIQQLALGTQLGNILFASCSFIIAVSAMVASKREAAPTGLLREADKQELTENAEAERHHEARQQALMREINCQRP